MHLAAGSMVITRAIHVQDHVTEMFVLQGRSPQQLS